MTFAVAEVKNPFKADIGDDRPPLNIGLFVEADIDSRVIENALRLPKEIVYRGREILVLNDDNQINFQTISVLRSNASSVVAVGIAAGTRIVATRISLPINGMRVAPILGPDIKSKVQLTSSVGEEL